MVTRAELRAGAVTPSQQDVVRWLLGTMTEYSVDRRIAEEAGRIRREHGLRLPDALIAATALVHSLSLHTRNHRDFRRVYGLRLRMGAGR